MDYSIIIGAFALIMGLAALIPLACFWRLREHPVIVPRFPILTTASLVIALFTRIIIALERIAVRTPCWIGTINISFGTVIPVIVYTLRAYVLWFNFELVHERIMYSRRNGVEKDQGWFIKHQYLITKRLLYGYAILVFFACFVLTALSMRLYISTDDYYSDGIDECAPLITANVIWLIAFVKIPFIVFFSFKLRGEYDTYGIKTELKMMAFMGSLIYSFAFSIMFGNFVAPEYLWVTYSIVDITSIICLSITSCYSIYRIRQLSVVKNRKTLKAILGGKLSHKSGSRGSIRNGIFKTLEGILSIDSCYRLFFEHCKKEFNVESILALEKVHDLQAEISDSSGKELSDHHKEMFMELWNDHISSESDLLINISAPMRKAFEDIHYTLDRPTFCVDILNNLEVLEKELMRLLANDPLSRFLVTDEGRRALKLLEGHDVVLKTVDKFDIVHH